MNRPFETRHATRVADRQRADMRPCVSVVGEWMRAIHFACMAKQQDEWKSAISCKFPCLKIKTYWHSPT
jgi:hypothetical protein